MAKIFEVGDVLPPKIKIYFDTTKHLTTPIDFQSMGLYGVYDSSATSTIILIPNPSSPLWGDLDTNFVYANWTKIYDITTKTWLMESIICDLSQYAPTERTMAHISGTANVLDFIAGMTWEVVESEPATQEPKLFEVGDVLPATTQLRIHFDGYSTFRLPDIKSDNNIYTFFENDGAIYYRFNGKSIDHDDTESTGTSTTKIYDWDNRNRWMLPFNSSNRNYIDIDTSLWSISKRTISNVGTVGTGFSWEDLAPAPSGYTITFNSNGGTTQTDLTEQTALPDPLPTTTREGYAFVAWYIDSALTTRAVAGATIEEDTTLYAKWHNLGTLFTGIANAIRSKDGTSGNIRDLDFDDRISVLPSPKEEETKTVTPNFSSGNQVIAPTSGKVLSQVTLTKPTDLIPENIAKDKNVCGVIGTSFRAIELTQTQYDTLSTKDSNTYYLIVEE